MRLNQSWLVFLAFGASQEPIGCASPPRRASVAPSGKDSGAQPCPSARQALRNLAPIRVPTYDKLIKSADIIVQLRGKRLRLKDFIDEGGDPRFQLAKFVVES